MSRNKRFRIFVLKNFNSSSSFLYSFSIIKKFLFVFRIAKKEKERRNKRLIRLNFYIFGFIIVNEHKCVTIKLGK